jgi:hypothetical protein
MLALNASSGAVAYPSSPGLHRHLRGYVAGCEADREAFWLALYEAFGRRLRTRYRWLTPEDVEDVLMAALERTAEDALRRAALFVARYTPVHLQAILWLRAKSEARRLAKALLTAPTDSPPDIDVPTPQDVEWIAIRDDYLDRLGRQLELLHARHPRAKAILELQTLLIRYLTAAGRSAPSSEAFETSLRRSEFQAFVLSQGRTQAWFEQYLIRRRTLLIRYGFLYD